MTLAESWNGKTWSIETTPNPSGATFFALEAVSCSAAHCKAVGWYQNNQGPSLTLAEAWNGKSWSIEATPNPSVAPENVLDGVSCTAADACTAVGSNFNGSGGVSAALGEAWNGKSWSIEATPNPSGSTDSELDGVSCPVVDACKAVGSYIGSSGVEVTLAEVSNGKTWSIKTTPNPAGSLGSYLYSISCTAADECTAVGTYSSNSSDDDMPLAEVWNGASWSIETTPKPRGATFSELDAVSCTAASACKAVGWFANKSGVDVPLAEAWNGKSWSVQTTPKPSGATASYLQGVSCTGADACQAVGYDEDASGAEVTLDEAWNGKSWSIETTPDASGATDSTLEGVSCTGADACIAVGSYYNGSSVQVTLVEGWNGKSWSIETTPNPSGAAANTLEGVSCTAADACTAVGWFTNSAETPLTLAEAWNGKSWSIETTPNPSGASSSALEGVSCTGAQTCAAAGSYSNSSSDLTLTEAES